MILTLYIIGFVVVISGIIAALFSGSFLGFLIIAFSCLASSILFFSLAKILDNQSFIINQIYDIKSKVKKPTESIVCEKCKQTYTNDFSYCPHCGARQ